MKAITLRDMPDPVAKRVEERARRNKTSLNRTVIEMLGEGIDRQNEVAHHDLDYLAATWTEEEAEEFDRILREQRTVDSEHWG